GAGAGSPSGGPPAAPDTAAAAPPAAVTAPDRPAGTPPPALAPQAVAVTRVVPRAVAAPAAGLVLPYLDGGIAVTDDGGGVAEALVARLRARGHRAGVVDTVPADAGAVVFLGGLRAIDSIDAALAVNREAFAVARGVAGSFQARGGALVTVQDLGGDFGLSGRAGERAWL